jgi:ATP-binding cassette, subfamily B, bacterial MsbA
VESFLRLRTYVWPQRRRLACSIGAALLSAGLWAAILTLTFPIVKVLLEERSLPNYVADEIQEARQKEAELTSELDQLELQLTECRSRPGGEASPQYAHLLRDLARCRTKLGTVSQRLFRFNGFNNWLIPWLPAAPFAEFTLILALMLAMTALKGGCEYLQETLVGSVVERTLMQVRERLFRNTLKLDCQTLSLAGTPQLMSRFTFDLTQLSLGLNLLGSKVVVEPLKAAACISWAFAVNWRLTALSLVFVPIAGVLFQVLGKQLKHSSRKQMETMAELYHVLEESLSSFRVVQAFGNERLHRKQFHDANKSYFHRAYQILRLDALSNPTTEFLATCAVFLALAPGAYLVLRNKTSVWGIQLATTELEVAELALLYTLLAGVLDPARKLSSVYSKLKKAAAAAERIFQLMDQSTLVVSADAPQTIPLHRQQIEFDRVHFHYAQADKDQRQRPAALENVTLKIPFGAAVAVIGENGSGKSTLVQLLLRFFDPHEGFVRIDGVDLRHCPPRDLRAQIGFVSQETLLFDGTIAENIRYGRPLATAEEIERAAELAHVTAFAGSLPLKLQTPVGEKGSRLSGGQRQRVSLARAMLRDPAILVLDEATSAIDAQSEQLIHQSLKDYARGRTTFVITHRMTPELAEFITLAVVMERGRVLAAGPPETLQRICPTYRRLCQPSRHRSAA